MKNLIPLPIVLASFSLFDQAFLPANAKFVCNGVTTSTTHTISSDGNINTIPGTFPLPAGCNPGTGVRFSAQKFTDPRSYAIGAVAVAKRGDTVVTVALEIASDRNSATFKFGVEDTLESLLLPVLETAGVNYTWEAMEVSNFPYSHIYSITANGDPGTGVMAIWEQPSLPSVVYGPYYSNTSAWSDTQTINAPDPTYIRFASVAKSVPGPLPFLGAFAGLGWTRKLRMRIRKA